MQIIEGQISSYIESQEDSYPQITVIERGFRFERPVNNVTALLQGFHFRLDSDEEIKTIKCELRTSFNTLSSRQEGIIQLVVTFESNPGTIVVSGEMFKAAFSYLLIGN